MGEATAEQSDRMCSSFSCLLCGNGSESAMKFIPNHLGVISCQKRWRQTGNRNATKCFLCKTYSANGVQLTNIQVRPAGQTFNACHISVTSVSAPKRCLYWLLNKMFVFVTTLKLSEMRHMLLRYDRHNFFSYGLNWLNFKSVELM